MRASLWPDATFECHLRELENAPVSTMSTATLVAEREERALVGFLEVGLRSHADGCDPAQPVGFIEGWFVEETFRKRGIGGALVRAAEEWARAQGCLEMASETWIDHEESERAHRALGFEIVDRCVISEKRSDVLQTGHLSTVFKHKETGRGVGNSDMIVAMDLVHLAGEGATHS
jgi:aminoglycoside 6'-N-acetyltransferase I